MATTGSRSNQWRRLIQILSDLSRPYIVESLTAPMGISYFWSFNSHLLDFKLEQLEYLEETTGPTIKLRIQNLDVRLPTSWLVLAVEMETYTIDCIPVAHAAAFDHRLLLFSPDDTKLVTTTANILEFEKCSSVVHPTVPKGSALIHPTGAEMAHGKSIFYGIVCGPHDLHRWIGGRTIGDILS